MPEPDLTATWAYAILIGTVVSQRTLALLLLIVASSAIAASAHGAAFRASNHQQWKALSGHRGVARLSRAGTLGIPQAAPMSAPTSVAAPLPLLAEPRPPSSPPPAVFVPPRS